MEADGRVPLSPKEPQIPRGKCKTKVGWVIRRGRNTGRLPGRPEAAGDQPPQLQASPERTWRPAGERWTINLPPLSSPRRVPARPSAGTDGNGPGAGRGGTALPPFAVDPAPPPPFTPSNGRGTASRAPVTCATARATWGAAGTQHRPAPPTPARGPALPPARALDRLTVKSTNQRQAVTFPSPLPPPAYGCCVIRRVTSGAVASWLRRRRPPANGLANRMTDIFPA